MNDSPTFSLSLVPPPADDDDAPATLDAAYAAARPPADFEPALIFEPIVSIPLLEDDRPRRIAG